METTRKEIGARPGLLPTAYCLLFSAILRSKSVGSCNRVPRRNVQFAGVRAFHGRFSYVLLFNSAFAGG